MLSALRVRTPDPDPSKIRLVGDVDRRRAYISDRGARKSRCDHLIRFAPDLEAVGQISDPFRALLGTLTSPKYA